MEDEESDQDFVDDDNDKDFDIEDYKDTLDSEDSIGSDEVKDDEAKEENDKSEDVGEDEETGPILPGGHRFDKKLVCIRYPGKVVNPDKAIQTLGGLASISTALSNSKRRLELRFRPSDGYCKAACGDRHVVSGFLLRIRVKKSRIHQIEESSRLKDAENHRDLLSAMPHDSSLKFPDKKDSSNQASTPITPIPSIKDLTTRIQSFSVDNTKTNSPHHKIHTNESFEAQQNQRAKSKSDKSDSTSDKEPGKDIPPTFDRNKYEDLSRMDDYELPKLKVLGRVTTEFRFTGLCDFQYLPITRSMTDPKKNECIYESIYPTGIPPLKWLDNKVPYFLPPAAFSRMDSVQQISIKTESKDTGPENLIGITRKPRGGTCNFFYFNGATVPTSPPKGIETTMRLKFLGDPHLQLIRSIFEERPIWSKNAMMYKTNFTSEQLRILLPSVAYYFIDGPWRIMWVRLGFDPRQDPSARIYQTLDYRLKSMHGLEQNVKGKRTYSNYILPYKSAPSKQKSAVLTSMEEVQDTKKDKKFTDDVYIYRDGMIPPSRQMFYQYCDVHTDEIQEMLAKLPDPLPGTKCDEKRGWLPSGFGDQCREIINRQVRKVLRKQLNIPENYPTTLPREKRPVGPRKTSRSTSKRQKSSDKKLFSSPKRKEKTFVYDSDADWEDLL